MNKYILARINAVKNTLISQLPTEYVTTTGKKRKYSAAELKIMRERINAKCQLEAEKQNAQFESDQKEHEIFKEKFLAPIREKELKENEVILSYVPKKD